MGLFEVDLDLILGVADVAGDVQIEIVGFNLFHLHPTRVFLDLFRPLLVGVNDPGDMLVRRHVLAFPFGEILGAAGINEQNIVRFLAPFKHQDTDRDAGGVEEVGGQPDDRVDMPDFERLGANTLLCTPRQSRKPVRKYLNRTSSPSSSFGSQRSLKGRFATTAAVR